MSTPDSAPLLRVRELRFLRNDRPIFGPLSFALTEQEALLIQGTNGAGKTTLMRTLAGLLSAQEGQIDLRGHRSTPLGRAQAFSYLGHLPGLKNDLTAIENLDMLAGLQGRNTQRNAITALDRVGLRSFAFTAFRELSAGQRKRLSLARTWQSAAPIWLLDEPYANLDLPGIQLVNTLIADHVGAGGSAILTSHGAYAAPPVRTRVLNLDPLTTEPTA